MQYLHVKTHPATVGRKVPTLSRRPQKRGDLQVVSFKKVTRKVEVVLQSDVADVGKAGAVVTVNAGFFRNFLLPSGLAQAVNDQVMEQIQVEKNRASAEKEAVQERAQKIATALQVARNFIVKKEVNDENGQIYGSVTIAELKDAIKKQTGLELADDVLEVPQAKEVGTFEVTANLHPNVQAKFNLVIQKA